MKQLDLAVNPELEDIFTGPAGENIEYCFNDSHTEDQLVSQLKEMLSSIAANMKQGNGAAVLEFGIRNFGDFSKFKNNIGLVLSNAQTYLDEFHGNFGDDAY